MLMNELILRKHSKLHRYCNFEPLLYPAGMMFEDVRMPQPSEDKRESKAHSLPTSQRCVRQRVFLYK